MIIKQRSLSQNDQFNIMKIALEANKIVPERTSTQGDDPENLTKIVGIENVVLRDEAPPSIVARMLDTSEDARERTSFCGKGNQRVSRYNYQN